MTYLNRLADTKLPITVTANIPTNSLGIKSGKYKPDYLAYQLSRIAKSSDTIEDFSISYDSTFYENKLTKQKLMSRLSSLGKKPFVTHASVKLDGVQYKLDNKTKFEPRYLSELISSKDFNSADLEVDLNDILA